MKNSLNSGRGLCIWQKQFTWEEKKKHTERKNPQQFLPDKFSFFTKYISDVLEDETYQV